MTTPVRQVAAEHLTEGKTVFVRGKLSFARLTRLIEGEELLKSDQRKVAKGMYAVGKPHTTATLDDAQVVFTDPANPTLEEKFVEERRYESKTNPGQMRYTIDSKGNSLPIIAIDSGQNDGSFIQDTSGQELAVGLDVTLVLRTYKPGEHRKRGLAIEQVIVNEPVRYYGGPGVKTEELAAHGIVFAAPPKAIRASEASAVGAAAPIESSDEDEVLPLPQPAPSAPQVQAQAPAPQEETAEQKLARLEAENAALRGTASDDESAVGPWGEAPKAGITYQD